MRGEYYKVEELGNRDYRINSDEQVFMDLFVGKDKALLFDTGHGYGKIKELVRTITSLPLIIVNSHGHYDHCFGNYQFREDIYIHPKELERCRESNHPEFRKEIVEMEKNYYDPFTNVTKNILPEYFDEESFYIAGCGNLVAVEEDHVFDLGGKHLKVIGLPGHTSGSIGLLYLEEKRIYAADAFSSFVWMFFPESEPLPVYLNTLYKVKSLDLRELLFSHQQGIFEKKVLEDYIETAENVDFEHSIPFKDSLGKGMDIRICVRKGYEQHDMLYPGYASIVLDRKHLSSEETGE